MKIEKNIPIPKQNKWRHYGELWKLLLSMSVWESIYFIEKRHSTVTKIAKMYNLKFTIRAEDKWYRVWRIK